MVVVGADVHKRTHTFVAVDQAGRELGHKTFDAITAGHQAAVRWARERFGEDLVWAIEDCPHLSTRLERDLLTAGQSVVRVPPKMMAEQRRVARVLPRLGADGAVAGASRWRARLGERLRRSSKQNADKPGSQEGTRPHLFFAARPLMDNLRMIRRLLTGPAASPSARGKARCWRRFRHG